MIMTDTEDRDLNEDRERQRRFVEEAFGLSDDDIETLLDELVKYRQNTEDYLTRDDVDEEGLQRSENDELEHVVRIGQNNSTPVDIYEINGEILVPHEQFAEILEGYNQTLGRVVDVLSKIAEGVERVNSENSERYYSDETWQAVEDLKKD